MPSWADSRRTGSVGVAEQIKRGSTGSMLQEHFLISGTCESETDTNKQQLTKHMNIIRFYWGRYPLKLYYAIKMPKITMKC